MRERIMAADGQWLMGWVMPRELLQGIGKDLHRVALEREGERIAASKDRAESLIEANQDIFKGGVHSEDKMRRPTPCAVPYGLQVLATGSNAQMQGGSAHG